MFFFWAEFTTFFSFLRKLDIFLHNSKNSISEKSNLFQLSLQMDNFLEKISRYFIAKPSFLQWKDKNVIMIVWKH